MKNDQEIIRKIKVCLNELEEAADAFINTRSEAGVYHSSIREMKRSITNIEHLNMQLEPSFQRIMQWGVAEKSADLIIK